MNIATQWTEHLTKIDSQVTNMWNFIIYNKFTDEIIETQTKTIDNLVEENVRLIKQIHKHKPPIEFKSPKLIKKKQPFIKNVSKELKTIRYIKLSEIEKKTYATKLYGNITSIESIINLKNDPRRYDFVNDTKFMKLYNLIPSLEELHKIIGMTSVKEKIFKSICYFLHGIDTKEEMNHVMITGPPGVGKTTIAKIIGSIYLQLDFLENDTFIVAKRSDLIGKYLGHTASKTQEVIDSALGGVLFIDEVYSLGNSEKKDSFAKECIDTINLNMSGASKPWLLIVGGYKEEIEKEFLAYNKGLERRFTVKLEINSYTANELYLILVKFINEESWTFDTNAITVKDIEENYSSFKYFGGDMRKLFQLTKEQYCVRMMKILHNITMDKKLVKIDFTEALKQFELKENDDYFQTMYT